ncbi:MAG: histidinol dehydrogenase [Termitinemataceae bacterium]|nr:MAG: histidinol dehydrogenase [Termitinemataceae bacterium]
MKTIKSAKPRLYSAQKDLRRSVADIIDDVIENGDLAVKKYAVMFDACSRTKWRLTKDEIAAAYAAVSKNEIENMKFALDNIQKFAAAQLKTIGNLENFYPIDGLNLGHKIVPVDSALCYVPGGSYPLYSTALMLIIPAKMAGVRRVAACSPTVMGYNGGLHINAKTVAAMDLAGADEIYGIGGVQAIAAFAYGTDQIAPVDMIVGPGNAYVAEAKRQCYGQVGIDFAAGPSEVLVIADETANAHFVAADLLAQCEHDKNAQSVLISLNEDFAKAVIRLVGERLKTLETAGIAKVSWEDYGAVYVADNIEEALEFANKTAPEHLELQCKDNSAVEAKLRNYGSLFVGQYSAEVFGDYAAGPNHTLPTMRAARYTGGLWVGTFLKTLCRQCASAEAAHNLSAAVKALAEGEGLAAHAAAAEIRNGLFEP